MKCNLERSIDRKLTIIFHNFRSVVNPNTVTRNNSDSSQGLWCTSFDKIIGKIREKSKQYSSDCPFNGKVYIDYNIKFQVWLLKNSIAGDWTRCFRFLDSCQHLSSSLDRLVTSLTDGGADQLKHLKCYVDKHHGGSERKLNLLKRKGGCSDDIFQNAVIKFFRCVSLLLRRWNWEVWPSSSGKGRFFQRSYGWTDIRRRLRTRNKRLEHFQPAECWNASWHVRSIQSCCTHTNMQFSNRYLTCDVLLLCDVITRYREMIWDRFQLEAIAFVSLPSLSYQACLKMTGARIKIITDPDMLQVLPG